MNRHIIVDRDDAVAAVEPDFFDAVRKIEGDAVQIGSVPHISAIFRLMRGSAMGNGRNRPWRASQLIACSGSIARWLLSARSTLMRATELDSTMFSGKLFPLEMRIL